MNVIYVVNYEKRDGHSVGHPLIQTPSLACDTAYSTADGARAAMRKIARGQAAIEMAMAGKTATPASLNAIPILDDGADSVQVTTMYGMIYRYFICRLELL